MSCTFLVCVCQCVHGAADFISWVLTIIQSVLTNAACSMFLLKSSEVNLSKHRSATGNFSDWFFRCEVSLRFSLLSLYFFCFVSAAVFSRSPSLSWECPSYADFPSQGKPECWHICFFMIWEQCEQNPMFLHPGTVSHLMHPRMTKLQSNGYSYSVDLHTYTIHL